MSVENDIENEIKPPQPESSGPFFDPNADLLPGEESRMVVGELIEEEEEEDDTLVLTTQERRDFDRLLTMGRRVKEIVVMDHPVTIQTLKTIDEMRIGLYTKDYVNTQGFSRAYQVGMCAAGVIDIDKSPVYQAISKEESEDIIFKKKADALKEYYPVVISQIYNAIVELEREFAELAIKLGKLSG